MVGPRTNERFPNHTGCFKLREILTCKSSVISGSTALQFMLGAPWVAGDLDIYVPFGTFKTLLRGHLMKEEGYITKAAILSSRIPPLSPSRRTSINPARLDERVGTAYHSLYRHHRILHFQRHRSNLPG